VNDTVLFAAVGLLVGSMVGLTGVGGGSIMTPILMLLFGQSPSVAVGTDLLFAATTKLIATASFGFSRRVDWPVVGRLLLGSVPGAAAVVFALWLTRRTPSAADAITSRALAIILALAAVALIFQSPLQRLVVKLAARAIVPVERHKVLLTAIAGLVLGVAVTLTSVGAGALGVVMLVALYPVRLTPDRLVATDIAHALPVTLIAGLGHVFLGHVNFHVLGALLLGSIPGVLIASRLTLRLPAQVTRVLIGLVLAVVSERMLFG
jgi:uncharacterized membrane protein YfcA